MKLTPGAKCPPFSAVTYDGKLVSIESLRGKRVWLSFYRYAHCPLCNEHIYQVADRYEVLQRHGIHPIAVFESHPSRFGKVGFRNNSPHPRKATRVDYPLVADPDKVHFKRFGCEKSILGFFNPLALFGILRAIWRGFRQGPIDGNLFRLPAHFLVDESGVIQVAHYGRHIADNISWNDVRKFSLLPWQPGSSPLAGGRVEGIPHAYYWDERYNAY